MNTIITIDLSKEVIPADVIATLYSKIETTKQKDARIEMEKRERLHQWEIDTRINLNTQLIEKGHASLIVKDFPALYNRIDLVKICKKLRKEFEAKGYSIYGWGEYAKSNKKVYELLIYV